MAETSSEIRDAAEALHALMEPAPFNVVEWLTAKELSLDEFKLAVEGNVGDSLQAIAAGEDVLMNLYAISAYAFVLGWVTRERRDAPATSE